MALAHELVYQSQNLAEVSVGSYVSNLIDFLKYGPSSAGTRIRFVKELEKLSFGLDTIIPIGFIVTELMSNCLKHAFSGRDQGEIRIKIASIGDGRHELVVSDNGIGLSDTIDIENPMSVGLELVSTFVEQLRGTLRIRRDGGTQIRVEF